LAVSLVEPADDDLPDAYGEALEKFASFPIPEPHRPVLARIYATYVAVEGGLRDEPADREALALVGPTSDPLGFFVLQCVSAFDKYSASSGAAILEVLMRLTNERCRPGTSVRRWARRRALLLRPLLEAWRAEVAGLDLTDALLAIKLGQDEEDPVFLGLGVRVLRDLGLIDPTRALDLLRADFGPCHTRTELVFARLDLRRLEPWLWCLGPDALVAALPLLERASEDDVSLIVRRISDATLTWACAIHDAEVDRPAPVWTRCAPHFARIAVDLHCRLERHQDDLPFLGCFWRTVSNLIAQRADALVDPGIRRAAVETATRALGKLRPLFRAANDGPEEAGRDLEKRNAFYYLFKEGVDLLARAEGLWPALKSLLLAFSALSVRAVSLDLRYWEEGFGDSDTRPPLPWRHVPAEIAELIHSFARAEEEKDPGLEHLREEFAAFCLERLKLSDGTPVEPRTAWRHCYVRAFRELRVNPRGRGHLILDRVSKEDPDDDVKKAARAAYTETRHGVLLPPGSSPRRAVFAAFWWLRQAHLSALGFEVDPQGAQRTRQKELRRTKEVEEHELEHS
jgi:hypothetical protein